jgi:hypothetical protein
MRGMARGVCARAPLERVCESATRIATLCFASMQTYIHPSPPPALIGLGENLSLQACGQAAVVMPFVANHTRQ